VRLAAQLRIVVAPVDRVGDGPITISSLQRKRPTDEVARPAFGRRALSTIFSTDGSIAATQHYIDSVHVRHLQRTPKLDARPPTAAGIVDTKLLRREVQNNRPKPIAWTQTGGVSTSAPIEIRDTRDNLPLTSDRIIHDTTHPIKADDPVRATHMISTTGHSWNGKMIPTSLSFILPK
jgi:hypothetical protein